MVWSPLPLITLWPPEDAAGQVTSSSLVHPGPWGEVLVFSTYGCVLWQAPFVSSDPGPSAALVVDGKEPGHAMQAGLGTIPPCPVVRGVAATNPVTVKMSRLLQRLSTHLI